MISTVLLVVLFGLLVIIGLILFGRCKMHRNWKELFYIYAHEHKLPCADIESCKVIQEVEADFMLRNNELLLGLGQGIVFIVIIIILAVLLLEKVITADAAVPIIAALVGISIGKIIPTIKNNAAPKNSSPTEIK
jgi:hypothetical protein